MQCPIRATSVYIRTHFITGVTLSLRKDGFCEGRRQSSRENMNAGEGSRRQAVSSGI
jgi:hypothetical protein